MRKIKVLAVAALVVLLAVFAALWYYMPAIMTFARQEILKQAEETVNGALYIDRVRLSGFFKFSADNVKVEDKEGEQVFHADTVTVSISVLSFLFNSDQPVKAISTVDLAKNSVLNLNMDEQQVWNVSELLLPSDDDSTTFGALIRLRDTIVNIKLPDGTWQLLTNGTIDAASNPQYGVDLKVKQQENVISAAGSMSLDGKGRLVLSSQALAVESFAALVKRAIAVDNFAGELKDVNIVWENRGKGNVFNGRLGFDRLAGDYLLEGNNLHVVLGGGLQIKDNKFDVGGMTARVNEQLVKSSGVLALNDQIPVADSLTLRGESFSVQKAITNSPFVGDVDFVFTFDGPLNDSFAGLLATGKVNFAQAKVADIALDSGDIALTYKDGILLLDKGQIGLYSGSAQIAGSYDLRGNYLAGTAMLQSLDLSGLPGGELSGLVGGEVYFSGAPSYDGLNFAANFNSPQLYYRSLGISNLTAGAQKAGGITSLDYLSGNIGAGYFNAQGIIDGDSLALRMQAADLPLQPVMGAFGREASGYVNAHAFITGSLSEPVVDAEMYARDGVVEQQPFKTVKGRFMLYDDVLTLQNVLLEMNYGVHYINGHIYNVQEEQQLDLTVISKAVRLEPIAALAVPGEKITGNADSLIVLTGTVAQPHAYGEILVYEASFMDYFIEKVSGRYEYSNDKLKLENFNVKFMQTSAFLNGTIETNGAIDLHILGDNVRIENFPYQMEEVEASGGLALNGSLTGTLSQPYFNGTVSSPAININGQIINDIQGEAWSEGGVNNYFRITFKQDKGEFSLDAGVDFSERFAHGILEVKNGNVNSLLAVAGQQLDVGGLLNGTILLNSGGKRNGLLFDATVRDAHVRNVNFEEIDVNFHLQSGKFTINRLEARQGEGRIVGAGTADLRGELSLEVGGSAIDASILTAFMEKPVDFRGGMNFLVQVSGSAVNPEVSASMQISPGSVENVTFDDLYGLFSVKDDVFNVDQLFISRGEYKISTYGKVPVDLLRLEENKKNPDSQMDLQVKLDNADLSLVPSIFTNDVEWGFGKLEGELNIRGTLENPRYYGGVQIEDGTLKFHLLRNPLDKIYFDAQFVGDKAVLNRFDAVMGNGSITARGTIDISDFSGSDYNLQIQTDKLELASEMVEGPLTASFEIVPQQIRDITRPLIKGDVLLENITFNLPVVPDFGESDSNFGLDVAIRFGDKVRLYNRYLYDMLLEGNLHIKGSTNYTSIEGTVGVKRGTIKYLNTPFRIDTATAGFPIPGSVLPTVNVLARSRIDYVDVYVSVRGPVDQMEVILTSDPPMSQQEIFRLITLKTRAAEGSTLTDDDMKGLLAAGLQMTIFGNVEDLFKESLGIDEFRIYQGPISNGVGLMADSMLIRTGARDERDQFNLYVGKYLTDKILLSYTQSFNYNDRRIGLQYEINRRLSLGTAIDEDNKMYYGIEYRISF